MPNKPDTFVDTSGWGCYLDQRQPAHDDATHLYRLAVAEERRLVTTDYIIIELVARADKEWSLVDCASFVVMQQRGLTEALTTDRHFEQAGFVRLLK